MHDRAANNILNEQSMNSKLALTDQKKTVLRGKMTNVETGNK
jgi:hypothetical protein